MGGVVGPRINIKAGDRAFFVGTTGSGKTTLARKLLAPAKDVVVVDPKHGFTWEREKLPYGKGVITSDFRQVMAHEGPEPLIYRPSLAECAAGLPWFWRWVWLRQNTLVYVDEVSSITKPVNPPVEFARCIQQGRSKQISVWCGTQRPAKIPVIILSESEHDFIFRLRHSTDKKRMAEYSDEVILTDPPRGHEFWYYGDRDQMLFKATADQITRR